MERRFRHHGLDRATFVPAIELTTARDDSQEWKAMAGRHTTAPTPLLAALVEAEFAIDQRDSPGLGQVELVDSVRLGDGGLLSLEDDGGRRHRLVKRDVDNVVTEISSAFRFSDQAAERSTGIAVDGDMLYLSFAADNVEALAACKLEDAFALLSPV